MSVRYLIKKTKKSFKEDSMKVFLKRIWNYSSKVFCKNKKTITFAIIKLMSKDRFYLREIQGSKMYLDLKDAGITKELICSDVREEAATAMMHKILKKGDIVYDIGANIGYYALMEAKAVGEKGKVYALEPVLSTVELLKKNIEVNNYLNVEVHEIGIGDHDGETMMYTTDKCNWNSMYRNKKWDVVNEIKVKIATLDNFVKDKEYPDLVRMDVEGYEAAVIEGMKEILEKGKPLRMFIEVHPHIMKKGELVKMLHTIKKYNFEIELIAKRSEVINQKLDDILNDEKFLDGSKMAFQIFFYRN